MVCFGCFCCSNAIGLCAISLPSHHIHTATHCNTLQHTATHCNYINRVFRVLKLFRWNKSLRHLITALTASIFPVFNRYIRGVCVSQRVAACRSVLHCSVLQCIVKCCSVFYCVTVCFSELSLHSSFLSSNRYMWLCWSVLQCVAARIKLNAGMAGSIMPIYVWEMCCIMLQCIVVCCSVLQCRSNLMPVYLDPLCLSTCERCVAVCCSVL